MKTRVVVLGAGFGGLELTTMLSEALGESVDVTFIDKGDAFVFGSSKIDMTFGREARAARAVGVHPDLAGPAPRRARRISPRP